MEYWYTVWRDKDVVNLGVVTGIAKHMTFWETLATLMCLMIWTDHAKSSVLILGDNTGSLQNVLDMKGSGPLLAVARELAWRKVREGWTFDVAHIPTEFNDAPDALSRQHDPEPKPFPASTLGDAVERCPPSVESIWRINLKED